MSNKKILFSEETDSAITGYAIGVSFFAIGLFLLLNPRYFFSPIVSYILGALIGAFGVLGTGLELSRVSKIKGLDNIIFGVVFLMIWFFIYSNFNSLWVNIPSFFLLVFGCYALMLGIIQGAYSIVINHKEKQKENPKIGVFNLISQSVLFLTQLCTLIIAIFNMVKAIGPTR